MVLKDWVVETVDSLSGFWCIPTDTLVTPTMLFIEDFFLIGIRRIEMLA